MTVSGSGGDLAFSLPPRLIAQVPTKRRGDSRLLVLRRTTGVIEHARFRDLPRYLEAGDLIVANESGVLPGRLFGTRKTGGRIETLLLDRLSPNGGRPRPLAERWTCLMRPARKLRPGESIDLGGGLTGVVGKRDGEIGEIELRGSRPPSLSIVRIGRTPLPPYIRRSRIDPRESMDRRRYRTVYQRETGSAAAPTAGLHFTPGTLRRLSEAGVEWSTLLLHLGPASFLPVRGSDPDRQSVPPERFHLPGSTARRVESAHRNGHRVMAVGTSSARVLEACQDPDGSPLPGIGLCDLFIRPGYRFGTIDALLTNFHLPGSTHLLLVAAFAGRDSVLEAYRQAVRLGYRFYSYGDAMLIL